MKDSPYITPKGVETGKDFVKGRMSLLSARFYNTHFENPVNFRDWSIIELQPTGKAVLKNVRNIFKDELRGVRLNGKKKGEVYNGKMSRATRSKVTKIISSWMFAIQMDLENRDKNKQRGIKRPYPTFITLTLSDDQRHTDNEIKRNFLNRFIIELKRKKHVENYFWRAEAQKNGRIHFHLIVDRYINKIWLTNTWNQIQCEYVESYKAKKMALHGKIPNNPPSTHIEKIESLAGLASYAVKYCTKDNFSLDGESFKAEKNSDNREYRKIEGRIWGCSDALKQIKPCEFSANDDDFENVAAALNTIPEKTQFYAVLMPKINVFSYDSKDFFSVGLLRGILKNHYLNEFKRLYVDFEYSKPPDPNAQADIESFYDKFALIQRQKEIYIESYVKVRNTKRPDQMEKFESNPVLFSSTIESKPAVCASIFKRGEFIEVYSECPF